MKIWTMEEEARKLSERFKGVNRAEFARDNRVSGGQAMVYQHITGRRPISLDAAQAYAHGFRCTLEEISPRLAMEVRKAAALGDRASEVSNATIPSDALSTITPDQQQMLLIMESIGAEASAALVKTLSLLIKNPREDMGSIAHEDTLVRSEFEDLDKSKEDFEKRGSK